MKKYEIYIFAIVILAIICLSVSELLFGKGIPLFSKQKQWSIGIYIGSTPFNLSSPINVKNPVLTANDVTDVPAIFVADPFMVKENKIWYMYFEVWNARTQQGDIGLAKSIDGLSWSYQQIVLDESFHLSYPYVFKWDNQYYMIPETAQADSLRLYKAIDFPTKWQFIGKLLEGKYLDPSLFYYNERWWMFVGDNNDTLRLYHSKDIKGSWVEHSKSPIVIGDASRARPAGRIIVYNDHIIRVTQDSKKYYGNNVRAFEIKKLTTEDYQEEELSNSPILRTGEARWNKYGMHQMDAHQVDEYKWIACVDGYNKVWVLNPTIKRFFKKQ